jgi:hypothetical protein
VPGLWLLGTRIAGITGPLMAVTVVSRVASLTVVAEPSPLEIRAGREFESQPRLAVRDAAGQPVAGYRVHASSGVSPPQMFVANLDFAGSIDESARVIDGDFATGWSRETGDDGIAAFGHLGAFGATTGFTYPLQFTLFRGSSSLPTAAQNTTRQSTGAPATATATAATPSPATATAPLRAVSVPLRATAEKSTTRLVVVARGSRQVSSGSPFNDPIEVLVTDASGVPARAGGVIAQIRRIESSGLLKDAAEAAFGPELAAELFGTQGAATGGGADADTTATEEQLAAPQLLNSIEAAASLTGLASFRALVIVAAPGDYELTFVTSGAAPTIVSPIVVTAEPSLVTIS